MFLKSLFANKSFIRQGLFLAFLSSVAFTALNASELKECKSEEDKKTGCIEKDYYRNGNLKIETPFKNGKLEGIAKSYYESGNLELEAPFKNGVFEGVGKVYHQNGNLKSEATFKNGMIEGIQKNYYENGNILSEIPFMNDKVHGSVKFYSKKLIWQANAQNGKLINGKCTNGKTLTNAHLARINKDINEGYSGGLSWLEVCED